MISLLFFFVLFLVFSAFLSGSEMAFVSANKLELRNQADAGNRRAQAIVKLQEEPQHFLTAVLIGNNIVNVAAIALLTVLLRDYANVQSEWAVTAVMAPLLIIFGETLPKDYCRVRSVSFLLAVAPVLTGLAALLRGPSHWIFKGVRGLVEPRQEEAPKSIFVSEEELRSLVKESTESGVLAHHEKQFIDAILDFERTRIDSVMIPESEVSKIPITGTVGEVKALARKTGARMMLVYEEIPSIIVGMVYVFDMLFEDREDRGLHDYLRAPIFLPRETSLEKAFLVLQDKRQSFAVVTDEYHDVVGVAPIERLLSRRVGM